MNSPEDRIERELDKLGLFRRWSELVDETVNLYETGLERGDSTGWLCVDKVFTVLPNSGQLTVVTGAPGAGKSELLDALMVNLSEAHGWRWAVFSPENYPVAHHMAKLAEKIARQPFNRGQTERMDMDVLLRAMSFIRDHFSFLDPDYSDPEFLVAAALTRKKNAPRFGIVVDPWNTLEHKRKREETETEYIGRALTGMINESRRSNVQIFLVAHPQKLQRQKDGHYPVPGPWDIHGSAHWFNKPDNILSIHRDKTDPNAKVEVHVQKVRRKTVGTIGMAELTYDRVTGTYRDPAVQTTTPYGQEP